MLKYVAVAGVSKAFSMNAVTRRAYRLLGNVALERMRLATGVTQPYLDRARHLVEVCDRYAVLHPGDDVLELGTGWLHWEATVLRLFFDVRVTLFDVWDNRLFRTYRAWVAQYGQHLAARTDLPCERRARALDLIERILTVNSFDELYDLLEFRYELEPSGVLDKLPLQHYALVVSADVLEHIPRAVLPSYLAAARQRLVVGGYSIHRIDLVDHYHYFDPTCSPKHFYRYSDRVWRRWFDNEMQYVNRVQAPQWRRLFDEAGFERVEEEHTSEPVGAVPKAEEFAYLSQSDVECLQMLTVHRTGG